MQGKEKKTFNSECNGIFSKTLACVKAINKEKGEKETEPKQGREGRERCEGDQDLISERSNLFAVISTKKIKKQTGLKKWLAIVDRTY